MNHLGEVLSIWMTKTGTVLNAGWCEFCSWLYFINQRSATWTSHRAGWGDLDTKAQSHIVIRDFRIWWQRMHKFGRMKKNWLKMASIVINFASSYVWISCIYRQSNRLWWIYLQEYGLERSPDTVTTIYWLSHTSHYINTYQHHSVLSNYEWTRAGHLHTVLAIGSQIHAITNTTDIFRHGA